MTELEIGTNLFGIISLIINAILVPYILIIKKECTHIKSQKVNNDEK